MQRTGIVSRIKGAVLPAGSKTRTIPVGLYKGLNMKVDFASQTQLFLGLCELETHAVIRRAVGDASWLIDVGAGVGELCLYYLSRHPEGLAIAIEPNTFERCRLVENLALNERMPPDSFRIIAGFAGSSASPGCVTLDEIDVDHGQCGFVKIDVEGHEVEVLAGARRLLSRGRKRFLIETHSIELERKVIDCLRCHRFETQVIDNAWWRLFVPEQRPIEHNRWIYAVS